MRNHIVIIYITIILFYSSPLNTKRIYKRNHYGNNKPTNYVVRNYYVSNGRFDVKNAALYLGLKEKTLAMMRGNGTGPKFIKRGRIFYFKGDLDAWLNLEGRFTSTSQVNK